MDSSTLEELLQSAVRELRIVGAGAAVWAEGRQVEAAAGISNADHGLPVTADTLFQIGSTTKVYNAALLMRFVDEGTLDLDEPIGSYVPGFQLSDSGATDSVTLRHLLSMSSGVDNGPYSDFGRGDDATAAYVAAIADLPHLFPPGSAFGYSNAGTIIAGHVIERVSNQCWEDQLRDRLLRPAGLHFSASLCEELVYHRVAVGHVLHSGGSPHVVRPWLLSRAMAPAGSTLCASAGDLARFGRLFLNDGQAEDGTEVLSSTAIKLMLEPQIQPAGRGYAQWWGIGPALNVWDDVDVWTHGGTTPSGSSKLTWIPSHGVVVATVCNVQKVGYPLHERILGPLLAEIGIHKPSPPKAIPDAELDFDRYVGTFGAAGVTYDVNLRDGCLSLEITKASSSVSHEHHDNAEKLETVLVPIGDDRFLPMNPEVATGRDWDISFWGRDSLGRATHLLNGVFPAKRLDDAGSE